MIVECRTCRARFEDEFRSTICPHKAFPANDGRNIFVVHEDSFLETREQRQDAIVLEAALKELRWSSDDTRYDHARWKRDVKERLWTELQLDLGEYT